MYWKAWNLVHIESTIKSFCFCVPQKTERKKPLKKQDYNNLHDFHFWVNYNFKCTFVSNIQVYYNIFYRLEHSICSCLSWICFLFALFSVFASCVYFLTVLAELFNLSSLASSLCLSLSHSHCIQQILESVNHCHLNGIVHRDLKVSMTGSNLHPCRHGSFKQNNKPQAAIAEAFSTHTNLIPQNTATYWDTCV